MAAAHAPAVSKLTTSPIDRRERRPVSMRGFALLADGTSHEILVLDLSYDGCGIATSIDLERGSAVKLSVLRRGAVDAEVRWCSGGKAGLVFTAEAPGAREHRKRNFERRPLVAEVSMRRLGRANYRVTVLDASPEGCRIELVERPNAGEHVLVRFEGLEGLEAEVVWVEGFTAGLRFERAVHPAVFDLLMERLGR